MNNSSLTVGKPKVKIKIKPQHHHSKRKLKELMKESDRNKFINNHHGVDQPKAPSQDDDDEEDDKDTPSLHDDEDYYEEEEVELEKDVPMENDSHVDIDRSSIDYEEKYDSIDPNKDDTIENRFREELDSTIEEEHREIAMNSDSLSNNDHLQEQLIKDDEKHVHWDLPPDHDESSEHIYSYRDTLGKQTVLMTMNTHPSQSFDDEIEYAKMLCVSIDIGEENAGYALVDQGASRALIRRSKLLSMKTKHGEIPVSSHCVLSSSGAEIPITSRFKSRIFTQGQYFGEVRFYVVEDTAKADICCDIVLGRVALAKSLYPQIDTVSGKLYNLITYRSIQCSPAVTSRERRNGVDKLIIIPEDSKQNKQSNKVDKILQKRQQEQDNKLDRLNTLISSRVDLSSAVREHLMTHLVKRLGHIDVPKVGKNYYVEYMMFHANEQSEENDVTHKMSELLSDLTYTQPNSEQEKVVINELFSLHVPGVLRKEAHSDKDEIMESVEDIDFPFTAPPSNKNDKQYIEEKRSMMKKLLDENIHLTEDQRTRLMKILIKYEDCFSMKGENLKQTDVAVHEIDTGDTAPFRERLRPYSPPIQAIIDKEVQKMIQQGILVPSRSPYASNLLLVRKPDPSEESGTKDRVCASFVRLNKLTKKDSYPLPNIQSIFDSIGQSKWFTTMDLLSGFWQVMIKPEHRHKTAVITARGLYEYVVMAFGLCNAPATFQRLMDAVVLPEYREFIQTYIDDVLTHSLTFEDHLKHLDKTLSLFQKNTLMVKLSKCKFAQTEVKFLGHVISQGTIKCNPEAVETIRKWKRPASGKNQVTAVRSFLGMVGWYRRFIPNFSTIAAPLYNLTKKNVKWLWTDECEEAFRTLIDIVTKHPVLKVADPTKSYILHTDASDLGLGAVLMQEDDDGHLHPIAFASKLLNPAQRNYTVTDRECLAMVWALEHFNTYVEGHKYTIVTDHAALTYLKNVTHTKQRMHRLALKLQPYELSIEYKPGVKHYAADLLSRSTHMEQINNNTLSTRSKSKSSLKKKASSDVEYEVEKIIDRRSIDGRELDKEYLVSWVGYKDPTWEPLSNLTNAIDKVIKYESLIQSRKDKTEVNIKNESSKNDEEKKEDELPLKVNKNNEQKQIRVSNRLKEKNDKKNTITSKNDGIKREEITSKNDGIKREEITSKNDGIKKEESTSKNGKDKKTYKEVLMQGKDEEESNNNKTSMLDNNSSVSQTHNDTNMHISQLIVDEKNCIKCRDKMTTTQRYVHNYHVHHIPVPHSEIDSSSLESDRILLKELQQKENQFRFIYDTQLGQEDIEDGITSKERKILHTHEFIYDDQGILYCIDVPGIHSKSRVRTTLRVCIPGPLRKRVMNECHRGKLSSHPGVVHMYDMMRQIVWWPGMLTDISHYVYSCEDCLKNKRKQNRVLSQPMSIPTGPWTHIAVDYIGPLPKTDRGNEYILTVIDRQSHAAEAFATQNCDTFTTANNIIEGVICRHGLFDVLQSDRGSGFVSTVAANIYKQLGIKQIKTTSYNPKANGVIEIFNKTLKQTLKIYANEYQNNWDKLLPYALFAYNTAYHSGIQETPFYMNHGRDAKTIVHHTLGIRPENKNGVLPYAIELSQKLYDVHKRVTDIYKEVNEERIKMNETKSIPSFDIGDKVYLYDPTTKRGYNVKLTRRWKGPYIVMEKINNVNYRVTRNGIVSVVNVQRMRALEQHDNTLEQYEYDLELAQEEMNAINNTVEALMIRKSEIEVEKNKIKAAEEIEKAELVNVNTLSVCMAISSDYSHYID